MKKFKVVECDGFSLNMFIDEIIEAEDDFEARDEIMNQIISDIGNYIDIELEEIEEDDENPDEYENYEDYKMEKEFLEEN